METTNCKICRRAGTKLFLKGDRCLSQKCPILRRAYAPGNKGKRRPKQLSEYGIELREKQKLKEFYNLGERQFKKYVKEVLGKGGKIQNPEALLIKYLEFRLDNIVFRLGIALSRSQARQLVSHGYFLVNGKAINIPSHRVKKGDVISLKPQKAKKAIFQNLKNMLKKYKAPTWLSLDAEKVEGKVKGEPAKDEVSVPVEIPSVFEFYSR